MEAAMASTQKGRMRQQFLRDDTIDIRYETPINSSGRSNSLQSGPMNGGQYPNQQFNQNPMQQQIPMQQHNPSQPFQQQNPSQQFNQYNQQYPPNQFQNRPFAPQQGNSRRSSLTSQSATSTMSKLFRRGGKGSKDKDDDFDEDGGNLDLTDEGNISFDDLSHLRQRGPYGMSSLRSSDTTPIIPTLSTKGQGPNGGLSNVQYRKQMTNQKKLAMASIASSGGRAMSLNNQPQFMQNPMNDPRSMSMAANYDPRAMSLNSNNRDPRAMSLQGYDPRAMSLGGQPPFQPQSQPQHLPNGQPRTMSLNNQYPAMNGQPRAMSLNNQQQRYNPNMMRNPNDRSNSLTPSGQRMPPPVGLGFQPPQGQFQRTNIKIAPPQPRFSGSRNNSRNNLSELPSDSLQNIEEHNEPIHEEANGNALNVPEKPAEPVYQNNNSSGSSTKVNRKPPPPSPLEASFDHGETPKKSNSMKLRKLNLFNDTPNAVDDDEDEEVPREQVIDYTVNKSTDKLLPTPLEPTGFSNEFNPNDFDGEKFEDKDFSHSTTNQDTSINSITAEGSFRSLDPGSPNTSMVKSTLEVIDSPFEEADIKGGDKYNSMVESQVSDDDLKQLRKEQTSKNYSMYQLSGGPAAAATNTEVFVTASQFSLEAGNVQGNGVTENVSEAQDDTDFHFTTPNSTANDSDETIKKVDTVEPVKPARRLSHGSDYSNNRISYASYSSYNSNHKRLGSVSSFINAMPIKEDEIEEGVMTNNGLSFKDLGEPPLNIPVVKKSASSNGSINSEEKRRSFSLSKSSKNLLKKLSIKGKKEDEKATATSDMTRSSSIQNFKQFKSEEKKKELNFTKEELGIMNANNDLLNELQLISIELASSIKREIQLENKLKDNNSDDSLSPGLPHDALKEEIVKKSDTISTLMSKLNNERRLRFISEEHALLLENGIEPSPLKLNYEKTELYKQLVIKNEELNQMENKINELLTSQPDLEEQNKKLMKENKNLNNNVIPNLKNELDSKNNEIMQLSSRLEGLLKHDKNGKDEEYQKEELINTIKSLKDNLKYEKRSSNDKVRQLESRIEELALLNRSWEKKFGNYQ